MLQAPQRYLNFIGNELKPADSGETIPVVDPSNGETFASIPRSRAGDVARAVHSARGAFEGAWGRFSAMERSRLLMRLASLVEVRRANRRPDPEFGPAVVLSDHGGWLRRPDPTRFEGEACLDDRPRAREMWLSFDRSWERAGPESAVRALKL